MLITGSQCYDAQTTVIKGGNKNHVNRDTEPFCRSFF